jgi:hypothetical protein
MTALNTLVDDCPADKRDQLAAFVAERLATGVKTLDDDDVTMLNTVLENTLGQLGQPTKRLISEKLAPCAATSSRLAMLLATDEASIAAPVLEKSPALSDDDLMMIAREKGQDRLMAISRRDTLNRDLANLLLTLGNADVRRFVLGNLGADISPEDFDRCASELPGKLGNRISHLRKSNEQLVQDLLKPSEDLVVGPELPEGETRIRVPDWIEALRTGIVQLDHALSQFCLDKNLMAVVTLIARISGVPEQTVTHLMIRFDATGLAVLCKTLGVGDLTYSTLCRVRSAHMRLPVSIGSVWASNYRLLAARDARRLLNLLLMKLDAAPRPAAPVQEMARINPQVSAIGAETGKQPSRRRAATGHAST